MGAIALAGAVKGADAANQELRQQQGFETEQALRKQQIATQTALDPLKIEQAKQAVAAGAEAARHTAVINPLNEQTAGLAVDVGKLTLDEKQKLKAETDQARQQKNTLNEALGQFHVTGNPQVVADAVGKIYPQGAGATATRNPDGSITVTMPDGRVKNFTGDKAADGSAISPDDQFGMFAFYQLDPVKRLEEKWKQVAAMQTEGFKQKAIGEREVKVAQVKANATANSPGATRANTALVEQTLDRNLKTAQIPGAFQSSYSNEDDAKLRRFMSDKAGEYNRAGKPIEKATNQAISDVRQQFYTQKKAAMAAAAALKAQGVDVNNADALTKAVQAGDKNAVALARSLAAVKRQFDADVARYLYGQLSTAGP